MAFLKNIVTSIASKLEIAPYTVTPQERNIENVEVRTFESQKWASIRSKGMDYDEIVSSAFWSLFQYIQGENDRGTKIEMTGPVATKIEPGDGPNCESTFTVSFYVPEKFQENTPQPTNPSVFIEQWPAMSFIARRFGGFAKSKTWVEQAVELGKSIENTDIKIREDFYYTAGYDAPFKLFNRRNEIWFVKVED